MNIAFKFAELKSRVIKKGTTYIGQIIHNHFLDTEAMVRIDAEQYHMPEPMARFNITSVVDFIESEMAEGNRLNFGSCSVSLKTCGRFERANAPYSAKDNPIRVVMTPGKRMRAAGTKLKPVSETVGRNRGMKTSGMIGFPARDRTNWM